MLACVRLDPAQGGSVSENTLIQISESLSPRFEFDGHDGLFLDVGEKEQDETITESFSREGIRCRVGIGSSKKVAELAALTGSRPVDRSREKEFLAPLPLDILKPSPKLQATLTRWGIKTLGALAHLPNGKVATLLGGDGWKLQQAARGIDLVPFTPYRRAPSFSKLIHLEWPILELSPFMFVAQEMLERLLAELSALDTACRLLNLHLQLDPSGDDERSIRLRSPTRELKTLLELLTREMRSHPPKAPITGIEIILHPDQAREMQLSLFGPPAFSPTRLATTLAQLYALVGVDRVGTPIATDGFRPERWALDAYDPAPPPILRGTQAPDRILLSAIRVLRPAIAIYVSCSTDWPYRPLSVRSTTKTLPIDARILVASGPWKMEERWWAEDGCVRDYWTVQLEDSRLLRLYVDPTKRWFVDGLYD